MKKLLLLSSLLIASTYTVFGQAEGSVVSAAARGGVATTMTTDYHSIGINPANLGLRTKYETKNVTFGFLEMNASAFAKGVTTQQMKDFIFNGNSLTPDQKTQAAQSFASNNISGNMNLMLVGIAIQSDKIGGIGFSINEILNSNGNLSQNFTNFAFSGGLSTQYFDSLRLSNGNKVPNDPNNYYLYNTIGIDSALSSQGVSMGTVFNGTNIKAHYYRTIDISYGREVFRNEILNISAGVGLKYAIGNYYMNVQSDGGIMKGNIADNPTFSSLSNVMNVPSSNNAANIITPLGHGFGFDLGVTAEFYDKLKVGASIVNIGSINYTSNTYKIVDTTIHAINYDASTADAFNETVFWKESSSFKVKLPTKLRFGASLSLLEKRLEIGGDIIVPLNKEAGNINKTIIAVGGDFYVKRWFKVSSGASIGGNYANSIDGYSTHVCIPAGVTFIAGENAGWEVGLSTKDIISLIDAKGKSPLYSVGLCVFRFRV